MRSITILFVFLLCGSAIFVSAGQELQRELTPNRANIARAILSRLEQKVEVKSKGYIKNVEMEKINTFYKQWEETHSESSWGKFTNEATKAAEKWSIASSVKIETLKNNIPQGGANIKYQLSGSNQVKTAKGLTPTTEYFLPIGIYHIWAERNGKVTSDRKSEYQILRENEKVEVNEYE